MLSVGGPGKCGKPRPNHFQTVSDTTKCRVYNFTTLSQARHLCNSGVSLCASDPAPFLQAPATPHPTCFCGQSRPRQLFLQTNHPSPPVPADKSLKSRASSMIRRFICRYRFRRACPVEMGCVWSTCYLPDGNLVLLAIPALVRRRRLREPSANGEFVNRAQIGGFDRRFQQTAETWVARCGKKGDHRCVCPIFALQAFINCVALFGRNPRPC